MSKITAVEFTQMLGIEKVKKIVENYEYRSFQKDLYRYYIPDKQYPYNGHCVYVELNELYKIVLAHKIVDSFGGVENIMSDKTTPKLSDLCFFNPEEYYMFLQLCQTVRSTRN